MHLKPQQKDNHMTKIARGAARWKEAELKLAGMGKLSVADLVNLAETAEDDWLKAVAWAKLASLYVPKPDAR